VGLVVLVRATNDYRQCRGAQKGSELEKDLGSSAWAKGLCVVFSPSASGPERWTSAPLSPPSGRTHSASWRAEADDEFRCAEQGCCVTRLARCTPSRPLFRTGCRDLPVFRCHSPAGRCPAVAGRTPCLPCALTSCGVRGPGPGRQTDAGHGERRCQVPAELLAPGPRAGREGPGVLHLSARSFCVGVSGPHHSPLGPRQVSDARQPPRGTAGVGTRGCTLGPCGVRVPVPGLPAVQPFAEPWSLVPRTRSA
jgi:hypothetical protein